MSYQTGAPEGEANPTHCPVCLEAWDGQERLPKFLICHHSICVSCAGELQRTAKKRPKSQADPQSTTPGSRQLGASRESLGSLDTTLDEKNGSNPQGTPPSWVRCPMCRTRTFIEDPFMLQTNFYLRGLPRSVSMPRLVLWCESCSVVATPDCGDHVLKPMSEKMRILQDELARRADSVQSRVQESLDAHESHMGVYRWLCGMLRHSHSKVLAALTHAAQYHQALQQHTDALKNLVKRGENLQPTDEPEEIIGELTSLLKELDIQKSAINAEVELPILKDTFQILRSHHGPRGYGRALVVLDADESVTLSLFGENDRQCYSSESDSDDWETVSQVAEASAAAASATMRRALSLQVTRRKREKGLSTLVPLQTSVSLEDIPSSPPPRKEETVDSAGLILVSPQNEAEGAGEKVLIWEGEEGRKDCEKGREKSERGKEETETGKEDSEKGKKDHEKREEEPKRGNVEPVIIPETTVPKIMTQIPKDLTLPRTGTFNKELINVSSRRYPPHMVDEEPIIKPTNLFSDGKTHKEQGGALKEAPPVTFKSSKRQQRPSIVKPSAAGARHQGNVEDDEVFLVEPVSSRHRPRRNKRGKKRPSHSTVRRLEEGDRYQQHRGRKQSYQRRRPATRKSNAGICRIA